MAPGVLLKHPQTGNCFTSCARREEICSRIQKQKVRKSQKKSTLILCGVKTDLRSIFVRLKRYLRRYPSYFLRLGVYVILPLEGGVVRQTADSNKRGDRRECCLILIDFFIYYGALYRKHRIVDLIFVPSRRDTLRLFRHF